MDSMELSLQTQGDDEDEPNVLSRVLLLLSKQQGDNDFRKSFDNPSAAQNARKITRVHFIPLWMRNHITDCRNRLATLAVRKRSNVIGSLHGVDIALSITPPVYILPL